MSVQIWDNAAFDNGESEAWFTAINPSPFDLSKSFESNSTKENHTPSMVGSPVSIKCLASPINPLQVNTSIANTQEPNQVLGKKGDVSDVIDLDSEIEEVEKEMNRLSVRLENLRIEKAKRNAKAMEKRGRVIAAKFMDPLKQSIKKFEEMSNIEDLSAKLKTPRRGLSMGPMEIMRGARRGISLGPAEIYSATKLKQLSKEITTPSSNRRQSCYWKLQNIDELKVTRERGKNSSLSPKSRSKTMLKSLPPKQAATTIGSKKTVKKEDGLISIQPKKLFTKDIEKSALSKKPMKCGRLVPSRYSQISNEGNSAMKEVRKRSWPENEEDGQKKRTSLTGKIQDDEEQQLPIARENRVKKRWEIPSVDTETPLPVSRLKISRFVNESPRDSGPAKRVSELIGRKPYFSVENTDNVTEEEEENVCQKECLRIRILRCLDESPRDSGAAKRVAELVGKKSFFDNDDHEMPVFSFEDGEES